MPTTAFQAVASLTRKNDTTAYSANDVLGPESGTSALTFVGNLPAQGEIMITTVQFEIDRNAVISGETSYRLYLYRITPPSAFADNAAFDLAAGDRASFLGYVDLGIPVDLGATLYVETVQYNKQITMPGNAAGLLYGYLVTIGAYTPVAETVHKITLHAAAL